MPAPKRAGQGHYDVAILGDSLAGRLTAALTAKKGCRVVMIHDGRTLPTAWLTSSLLMERILDLLDGRSCLSTPFRFQVIARNQRVDFNGQNALIDELRRELPDEHAQAMTFLDDLKSLGEQLEEMFWEHHGLPTNRLGNRLRFKKNCFRADVPGRVFRQTLRDRLAQFSEPGARKLLTSLFCGFAFAPSNTLTLAECALIWSALGRQRGLVRNGLEELLWHRFRQFHGDEEDLHRLARVRSGKDGSGKFLFEDDRVVTADHLVFANRETIALCEGLTAPPGARMVCDQVSANLRNRISPLLARHVILDGNPPLRLSFEETDASTICRVENAALGDRGLSSIEQIESRLARILPFVDLALTSSGSAPDSNVTIRTDKRPSLFSAYERIVFDHGRKMLCNGAEVIPELGSVGEVLVAVTVTNRLLQATGDAVL